MRLGNRSTETSKKGEVLKHASNFENEQLWIDSIPYVSSWRIEKVKLFLIGSN